MKRAVFLSRPLIGHLLKSQADAVQSAFVFSNGPTKEQVEDLQEICRAWLSDEPGSRQETFSECVAVTYDLSEPCSEEDEEDDEIDEFLSRLPSDSIEHPGEEEDPKRTLKLQKIAVVDPPLPETFGQMKEVEAPVSVQLFPPKIESMPDKPAAADWPPKASRIDDGPLLKEAPPQTQGAPSKVQINTSKAIKAARFFTAGIPAAQRESGLITTHLLSIRTWLCGHFDCTVSKLGREVKPDAMAAAITDASLDGVLTIPYVEAESA